ncbi:sigma-54 interaction domain-containing protein [Anaerotignum sp. MB30-C6]|uniref:sigma-54 interaction domain-containing protein n=1 Tax=Anaerotignum sp. MB30-C6 TaxID=3070814 RepID=UPI0027DCEB6E|nr:sigma 54-interacting transcriptional regulator [Anaerotignum sp. MB30-C6]WMI82015.1 sigma 54-interacting transcriptional regulator [Anaerotignum sp. MB30-C6]
MFLADSIEFEEFIALIDNVYDEIFIWDSERRVVYANKACYRHYGLMPEEIIGKTLEELSSRERLWWPSCVPTTMEIKEPFVQRQRTFLNVNIVTISVPIFDEYNNVKYVVQSVRDDDSVLQKSLSFLTGIEAEEKMEGVSLIAQSPIMKETISFIDKIAKTKAHVLILGETGTGKSLFAKYIHEQSGRKDKPFIDINIASLSPAVIESELFGYKKGAFTGANKEGKKGIFELANGGTLFLDEIGELPYDLQAKFLHVLQEEEVFPVGGTKPIKLDIRIICATNCDLEKMIEAGRFREDLFHRINTFDVTIPPLRKRKEDIKVLTTHYLNVNNKKYGKNVFCSDAVLEVFQKYKWSGNVRELSNVIERSVIMADGESIEVTNLPESFFSIGNVANLGNEECLMVPFDIAMEELEKKLITSAFKKHKSSRKVATALKISQSKANRLIRKYIEYEE